MEWAGFATLRPGRIHIWCPACHRKLSNMPRQPYDPQQATLVHVCCPRCCDSVGAKDPGEEYFDSRGRRIEPPDDDEYFDGKGE